jgi:hypothetical protein
MTPPAEQMLNAFDVDHSRWLELGAYLGVCRNVYRRLSKRYDARLLD